MNFENAVGVSFNRSINMAGDHLPINYILELNIRAEALSIGGEDYSATHSEVASQSDSALGIFYQDISINGQSFGSGYVRNISADPEGPDTQRKTYSATVVIPKEGQLDEVLPSVSKELSKEIENISESYTESRATHRVIVNHSCSVKLNPRGEGSDSQGKTILEGILKNEDKLESLFNIDKNQVYDFKNYTFDSESETYNFQSNKEWVENQESDENTIVIKNGSFEYSNGIINATFSVEITGNVEGSNIEERSKAALEKASGYINSSSEELYNRYKTYIPGTHGPLKEMKVNKTIIFNRNEAKCTVTVTQSNSQDLQDGFVYWDYSIETQELAAETISSENGTIIGGDEFISLNELTGSENKFTNAEAFLNGEASLSSALGRSKGGKCIRESITRGYGEGIIRYSYSFSNNPSLLYGAQDGGSTIKRKQIDLENEQDPLSLFSTFLIPESKELLQQQKNLLPNLKIKTSNITTNSTATIGNFIGDLYKPSQGQIAENISIRFSPKKRECVCETRYLEIIN